jgi:hypothetical protein
MKNVEQYLRLLSTEEVYNISARDLYNLAFGLCQYWVVDKTENASGLFSERTWFGYEYKIWNLGEKIRRILLKRKDLRKAEVVHDLVKAIILDKKYGKGREPFALILGEFKIILSLDDLRKAINDEEIQGHILKSLIKLKIKGFENEAEKISIEKKGWIAKTARDYLNKSLQW